MKLGPQARGKGHYKGVWKKEWSYSAKGIGLHRQSTLGRACKRVMRPPTPRNTGAAGQFYGLSKALLSER